MLGAIAGDIIGSVWENTPAPEGFKLFTKDSRFTDDTILITAITEALMNGNSFQESLVKWCSKYPDVGYGMAFKNWFQKPELRKPYNSWGNGSAVRVVPIGYLADLEVIRKLAKESSEITHNHPEAILAAEIVAESIYLLRTTKDKQKVTELASKHYNLDAKYKWSLRASETVPVAVRAFLNGNSFEECIRNAVMTHGDADTIAAITGAFAEIVYPIPEWVYIETITRLPEEIRNIVNK
jgi:ADP-ribosylglycohydrolase